MFRSALTILVTFVILAASPSYAQTPRNLNEIPAYPGSQIDYLLLEQEQNNFDDSTTGMKGLLAKGLNAVSTTATPDEVFKWYVTQLKAVAETGNGYDPGLLKPGSSSPVQYSLAYYEPEDFENQYDHDKVIYDGQWVQTTISSRARSTNGKILRYARFIWELVNTDGSRSEIDLTIDDAGFDYENKKYTPRTSIVSTYMNFTADAGSDESGEGDDSEEDTSED